MIEKNRWTILKHFLILYICFLIKAITKPELTDIVIIFGIMCCKYLPVSVWIGDDAAKAVTYGIDGILVSNHGARQLDGVPATVGHGHEE